MRAWIACALKWALERALPGEGRRRVVPRTVAGGAWARPWSTPVPGHVRERRTPLRGEDSRLVRPYAPLDDTLRLRPVRPRRVLVYAATGLSLPGTVRTGVPAAVRTGVRE
ncbi:hypothetical protein [Streptomyces sp. NPDC004726]